MGWKLKACLVGAFLGLLLGFYFVHLPEDADDKSELRWQLFNFRFGMVVYTLVQKIGVPTKAANWLLNTFWAQSRPALVGVNSTDTLIEGIAVRIYESETNEAEGRPVIVFFHGGGFRFGSPESYDYITWFLAFQTGYLVVSVDYRMLPNHPYPASHKDCEEVVKYLQGSKGRNKYRIDPKRIALVGDSAGGNLALSTALMLQESEKNNVRPTIKVVVSIYPATQFLTFCTPSYMDRIEDPLIPRHALHGIVKFINVTASNHDGHAVLANKHSTMAIRRKYAKILSLPELGPLKDGKSVPAIDEEGESEIIERYQELYLSPRLSPLLVEQERLEAMAQHLYVLTSRYDPVRSDGLMLAKRLRRSKKVKVVEEEINSIHGALSFAPGYKPAQRSLQNLARYIIKHL